jgi:uncharacterized cofD-like protein
MSQNTDFHLVAIGGGNGTGRILLGARPYFARLTAVVAVTDTGRSTGIARRLVNMPAPGDLRSTLTTLAREPESQFVHLLQHRFHSPGIPVLDGMAFGNLLIAALAQITGDFTEAIRIVSEQVQCVGQVLPVSSANTNICAELEDGSIREHELEVRGLNKPPIRRLFLADPDVPAFPPALEAIAQADVVVIGPGSFYTSLLSCLLFKGMAEALRQTSATVVFACNTTTQSGQTDRYRTVDHVQAMVEVLGPGVLDVALINRSEGLSADLLAQYAAEGIHLLRPDDEEIARIAALGVHPLVQDFVEVPEHKRELWNKQDTLRHDLEKLERALWKIAVDHGVKP